ncbi:MAG: VCBS domain-containing protein [Parvularculales bacterium]
MTESWKFGAVTGTHSLGDISVTNPSGQENGAISLRFQEEQGRDALRPGEFFHLATFCFIQESEQSSSQSSSSQSSSTNPPILFSVGSIDSRFILTRNSESSGFDLFYIGTPIDYDDISQPKNIIINIRVRYFENGRIISETYKTTIIITDDENEITVTPDDDGNENFYTVTADRCVIKEGYYKDGLKLAEITIEEDSMIFHEMKLTNLPEQLEYREMNGNTAELWVKRNTELDYESFQSLKVKVSAVVKSSAIPSGASGTEGASAAPMKEFSSNLMNFELEDGDEAPVFYKLTDNDEIFTDDDGRHVTLEKLAFKANELTTIGGGVPIARLWANDLDMFDSVYNFDIVNYDEVIKSSNEGDDARIGLVESRFNGSKFNAKDYFSTAEVSSFGGDGFMKDLKFNLSMSNLDYRESNKYNFQIKVEIFNLLNSKQKYFYHNVEVTQYPADIIFDDTYVTIPGTVNLGNNNGVVGTFNDALGPHDHKITYDVVGRDSVFYEVNDNNQIVIKNGTYPFTGSNDHKISITAMAGDKSKSTELIDISVNGIDVIGDEYVIYQKQDPAMINLTTIDPFDNQPLTYNSISLINNEGVATTTIQLAGIDSSGRIGVGNYSYANDVLTWTPDDIFTGIQSFALNISETRTNGAVVSEKFDINVKSPINLTGVGSDGSAEAYEDNPLRNSKGFVGVFNDNDLTGNLFVRKSGVQGDGTLIPRTGRTQDIEQDLDYGKLIIDDNGNWSYELDDNFDSDGSYLGGVTSRTDSFIIKYKPLDDQATAVDESVTDKIEHTIVITIHGATDKTATIQPNITVGSAHTAIYPDEDVNLSLRQGTSPTVSEFQGGTGDDVIYGTVSNNIIRGGDGEDWLFGAGGDDTLYGGGDADTIDGGPGNDVIDGGPGADILSGGGNENWFTLYQGPRTAGVSENDRVTDFDVTLDKININTFGVKYNTLESLMSGLDLRISYEQQDDNTWNAVIFDTNGTITADDHEEDDTKLMTLENIGHGTTPDDHNSLTMSSFVQNSSTSLSFFADGINGFRIDGNNGQCSGMYLSSAGDIDNNGYDDILIGTNRGEIYVILANDNGINTNFNLNDLAGKGFRITGVESRVFATVGDVNSDERDDILLGSAALNSGFGYSYMILGQSEYTSTSLNVSEIDNAIVAAAPTTIPPTTNQNVGWGFRINGEANGEKSGYSVSYAGDLNGDNRSDFIIGAPFAGEDDLSSNDTNFGYSYVVYGRPSTESFSLDFDLEDIENSTGGSYGFRIKGADSTDMSGSIVSYAGDVNGDGNDDILVVSPGTGTNAGKVYIIYGRGNTESRNVFNLSDIDNGIKNNNNIQGYKIEGFSFDHSFLFQSHPAGFSVAAAGDVNGDGNADIVIGGIIAGSNTKSSYVVFGRDYGNNTEAFDIGNITNAALNPGGYLGFRIIGENPGDYSGYSVSTAGDFNGDGYADIIIGAFGADHNGKTNSGSSYIIFGKAGGFGMSIDLSSLDGSNGFRLDGVTGGNTADQSGRSVSSAGDVNGDGYDDIMIGAYTARPPKSDGSGDLQESEGGSTYVVYGYATSVNITGLAYVGQTLIATNLQGEGNEYTWKHSTDDGTFVALGTGQEYILTNNDLGKTIRVEVESTNLSGDRVLLVSESTATISNPITLSNNGENHTGSNASELILGGSGDDTLISGGGLDVISGGGGDDLFILNPDASAGNIIEIRDFDGSEDKIKIDLDDSKDTSTLEKLKNVAGIDWKQFNHNASKDSVNNNKVVDTVIYNADGDILMVLQDFIGNLDITDFEIV